jgi:hypothetical protein
MLRCFGNRGGCGGLLCRRGEPATASPNSCMNPTPIHAEKLCLSPAVASLRLASIIRPATVFLSNGYRCYCCGRGLCKSR